jgi:HEAT repeat protein
MSQNYNIKNIRTLLKQGFTPDELLELSYDEPTFRPVYEQLSTSAGKGQIVQRLIEYAERQSLLDHLLNCARERNLASYEQYQPYTASPTGSLVPPAVKQAVATLDSPIQSERLNAVESLAALVAKHPVAQEKLADAVQHADYPDIRIQATFTLFQLKDLRAVPGLIEALNNDEKYLISESNLKVLEQIEDSDFLWPDWFLRPTKYWSVRFAAIWALGLIGDTSSASNLIKFLHTGGTGLSRIIAWALGRIGDTTAIPDLDQILRNAKEDACYEAAIALARMGAPALPNCLRL